MRRDLFTEDHEAFRELAREFVEKEVVPAYPEWEKAGRMPRDVFKQMGDQGELTARRLVIIFVLTTGRELSLRLSALGDAA
jgi:alkylation response protein AidB-like acyl-CoA dehydrogenase